MFTGIVEIAGKIKSIVLQDKGAKIFVEAPLVVPHLKVGSSVAVNGACLTVEKLKNNGFEAAVVAETLNRANFKELKVGDLVNLEKAATFGSPIDGHILTGHIDCTGMITNIDLKGNSYLYTITFPEDFAKYIVPKGSVGVDGISLTIVEVRAKTFTVSIIPHTLSNTTLKSRSVGKRVNLEFDILSKYVEKHLGLMDSQNNDLLLEGLVKDLPGQNFLLN